MPPLRTLSITCPSCKTILIVNKDTGAVIEERKPLVENSSGDRFSDALQAQREHGKKMSAMFTESLSSYSRKEAERRELFEEALKKAKESGDETPEVRDIDLT